MTKNFDWEIKTLDGEVLRDQPTPEHPKGRAFTAKTVAVNALLLQGQQEQPTGEEKVTRYELASRIHAGGDVDLTPEEIALVKKLVGVMYTPVIVGPVFAFLNK